MRLTLKRIADSILIFLSKNLIEIFFKALLKFILNFFFFFFCRKSLIQLIILEKGHQFMTKLYLINNFFSNFQRLIETPSFFNLSFFYYFKVMLPVSARNKPSFPCSLGKKCPPPTSGNNPKNQEILLKYFIARKF